MKIITLASLALLTGCAAEETYDNNAELSAAKAPTALTLEVADLHAGYLSNLSVSGGDAFEDVYLFQSPAGIGTGGCPRLLAGECFDLLGIPRAVALSTTDADGYAEFLVAPRLAALEGADINFQVVAFRSVGTTTLSNAAAAPVTIAANNFVGNFVDSWGTELTVTPNYMSDSYDDFWHITNTGADFIIALNDSDNSYDPGLWTRIDFAADDLGVIHYCMSTYDAATEAAALAATPADGADLNAGCGGYSWSALEFVPVDLTGSHIDDYGMSHEIDSSLWSDSGGYDFEVYMYSNTYEYLIAQNSASNASNAGLWSRFNWTVDAVGDTYYCQGAYDSATPARALIDGLFSDPTDLAAGCGGFAWSNLSP
jgi:hypothetical protein